MVQSAAASGKPVPEGKTSPAARKALEAAMGTVVLQHWTTAEAKKRGIVRQR